LQFSNDLNQLLLTDEISNKYTLNYTYNADTLTLNGKLNDAILNLILIKENLNQLPAHQDGFDWSFD
jgi:hypothetical protein